MFKSSSYFPYVWVEVVKKVPNTSPSSFNYFTPNRMSQLCITKKKRKKKDYKKLTAKHSNKQSNTTPEDDQWNSQKCSGLYGALNSPPQPRNNENNKTHPIYIYIYSFVGMYVCLSIFIQSLQYGQDMTQGQFLNRIKWVWI